jgi:diguanylate cyclase (GGDEF)-like protein
MPALDTPLTALLAAMLLQQAFLSLMWLGGAWLRLARRPALHWGAAMALLGCGMGLIGVRDVVDPWLGRWLANALNLAGFVLAARGAALFTRTPPRDREQALVLTAALTGTALAMVLADDPRWLTVLASGAMAWLVLRAAWLAGRALHPEFGAVGAWLCAAPLAGIGLLTAARALGAAQGWAVGAPLDPQVQGTTAQTSLMLGFIAMTLLVNGGFCGMVLLRLIGRLRHLSLHDPLTGLPNRRSLLAALADEHRRLARGGRPYALLTMDVDHFKRVNDAHGHGGGDAALVHIAGVIRGVSRASDRPARIGGEEFVLLLPATDAAGARHLGERLLRTLRERPLQHGGATLHLTLSIGIAVVGRAGAETEQELAALWKRADAALYAAKAQGRDRLVFSEPA